MTRQSEKERKGKTPPRQGNNWPVVFRFLTTDFTSLPHQPLKKDARPEWKDSLLYDCIQLKYFSSILSFLSCLLKACLKWIIDPGRMLEGNAMVDVEKGAQEILQKYYNECTSGGS